MNFVMIDIEADGPIPGDYSMVSFGAVVVEDGLSKKFYRELKPISEKWVPGALAACNFTREQTLGFADPKTVMLEFTDWLQSITKPGERLGFISDNNGFDWQFINWYFHHFTGNNPFGHSSSNLNSLFKGYEKNLRYSFKKLRKTKHDHNALNDSIGNAECLLILLKNIQSKKYNPY